MAANMFGKVSVGITANTGGLTAGLNSASSELQTFSLMSRRLGGINLATGFLAATKAIGLAVSAIRGFSSAVNSTVQAAASLVEQQNRVNIVFGESAKAVSKFAQGSSAIGFSEKQALEAAGTFGTLFENIGLTEAASAQMSMRLVGLTSDMASFNEVSIEDALRAMRSALVGEVEPIRRLGVQLDDATLRQYAFNAGLVDTVTKTLPPAIKMQAAYAAIIEKTKIQQGDFARNTGTLANQQKQLGANFENLKTQIGQAFAPIFLQVVNGINNVIPNLKALAAVFVETFHTATAGMLETKTVTESFEIVIRSVGVSLQVVNGMLKLLYAFGLDVMRGFVNIGGAIYKFLSGTIWVFGHLFSFFETFGRVLITAVTWPLRIVMRIAAKAADSLGSKGLGKELRVAANGLMNLWRGTSGVGEALQKSDFYGDLARNADKMATDLGERAGEAFRDGIGDLTGTASQFDSVLFAEKMKAGIADMIPVFGEIGQQFGKAAGEEIAASTKQLSAIVVNSSAGEAFRNAILRGADPRLAQNTDQKIADNTGRTADGIAALPDNLGAALGTQFARASLSV